MDMSIRSGQSGFPVAFTCTDPVLALLRLPEGVKIRLLINKGQSLCPSTCWFPFPPVPIEPSYSDPFRFVRKLASEMATK